MSSEDEEMLEEEDTFAELPTMLTRTTRSPPSRKGFMVRKRHPTFFGKAGSGSGPEGSERDDSQSSSSISSNNVRQKHPKISRGYRKTIVSRRITSVTHTPVVVVQSNDVSVTKKGASRHRTPYRHAKDEKTKLMGKLAETGKLGFHDGIMDGHHDNEAAYAPLAPSAPADPAAAAAALAAKTSRNFSKLKNIARKVGTAALTVSRTFSAAEFQHDDREKPPHYDECRAILEKPPAEREPEELQTLSKLLKPVKFFSHLGDAARVELAKVMTLRESVWKRDVIFEQGQTGDTFYVVLLGSYSAWVRNKTNFHARKVATMTTGDAFGELALISADSRRAATVQSDESKSELLCIAREHYDVVVRTHKLAELHDVCAFLQRCALFKGWEMNEIAYLAQKVTFQKVGITEKLWEEGDELDVTHFLPIIRRGEVEVYKNIRVSQFPTLPQHMNSVNGSGSGAGSGRGRGGSSIAAPAPPHSPHKPRVSHAHSHSAPAHHSAHPPALRSSVRFKICTLGPCGTLVEQPMLDAALEQITLQHVKDANTGRDIDAETAHAGEQGNAALERARKSVRVTMSSRKRQSARSAGLADVSQGVVHPRQTTLVCSTCVELAWLSRPDFETVLRERGAGRYIALTLANVVVYPTNAEMQRVHAELELWRRYKGRVVASVVKGARTTSDDTPQIRLRQARAAAANARVQQRANASLRLRHPVDTADLVALERYDAMRTAVDVPAAATFRYINNDPKDDYIVPAAAVPGSASAAHAGGGGGSGMPRVTSMKSFMRATSAGVPEPVPSSAGVQLQHLTPMLPGQPAPSFR